MRVNFIENESRPELRDKRELGQGLLSFSLISRHELAVKPDGNVQ